MKKELPDKRSDCSISYALDYLGDRWTLLVLRDLLFQGKRRFGDFATSAEGIASNVLTDRLKSLEAAGMITRSPDPENGRSVLYAPTQKAVDLLPVLLELTRWSARYDPHTRVTPRLAKRIVDDRDNLIEEIVARLKEADGE